MISDRTKARLWAGLEIALGVIAGVLLLSMIMITAVDVLLRYVFNAPLRGGFEITELMLVGLIFSALPLVSRREEHVVMDMFDSYLPVGVYVALRALEHIVSAVAMAGMSWLIWRKAQELATYGDMSAVLQIKLAPYAYAVSALLLITAAIHAFLVFAPRRSPRKPASNEAARSGAT